MPINVIDVKQVNDFLEEICGDNKATVPLLQLALTRHLITRTENLEQLHALPEDAPQWLKKKWPEGGPYYQFKPEAGLKQTVKHIADWLNAAMANDEQWLARKDEKGRCTRLLHLSSLEDATQQADSDMQRNNRRAARSGKHGAESDVMSFPNGYRIVQLLDKEALDHEGGAMGHCIGQGAYDNQLDQGTSSFFSLRDRYNEPHITIEIDNQNKMVEQYQGKENNDPIPKYMPYFLDFIARENFTIGDQGMDLSNANLKTLPEGLHIDGDLVLENNPLTSLPGKLYVQGELLLGGTQISELPDDLFVGGKLTIGNTPMTTLPTHIRGSGSFDLTDSNITHLPDHFQTEGSVTIGNAPITALPAGMKVGGNLNLEHSKISRLPDDLEVEGSLVIGDAPITALPPGLIVGGSLNLNGTRISELPDAPQAPLNLIIGNAPIKELPEDFTCGNLDLKESAITSLPENLEVGNLTLNDKIQSIPESIVINGDLDLRQCPHCTLPAGLEVGGNLWMNDSMTQLPDDLTVGALHLNKAITELPKNLMINGPLDLTHSNVAILNTGLEVKSLTLNDKVKQLPEGLVINGDFKISDNRFPLPENMTIMGDLTIDVRLKSIPKGIKIHGEIRGVDNLDSFVMRTTTKSKAPSKRE